MAYSEALVKQIRATLTGYPKEFTEKKMFGGIAFLYKGKMTVGAINHDLMVRVVGDKMESVLTQDHVRPMDFTGKPMKEFVFLGPNAQEPQEQLTQWIELGLEHAKQKLGE